MSVSNPAFAVRVHNIWLMFALHYGFLLCFAHTSVAHERACTQQAHMGLSHLMNNKTNNKKKLSVQTRAHERIQWMALSPECSSQWQREQELNQHRCGKQSEAAREMSRKCLVRSQYRDWINIFSRFLSSSCELRFKTLLSSVNPWLMLLGGYVRFVCGDVACLECGKAYYYPANEHDDFTQVDLGPRQNVVWRKIYKFTDQITCIRKDPSSPTISNLVSNKLFF